MLPVASTNFPCPSLSRTVTGNVSGPRKTLRVKIASCRPSPLKSATAIWETQHLSPGTCPTTVEVP